MLLAILDLMFSPILAKRHPALEHMDVFCCHLCRLLSATFVSLTFDTQVGDWDTQLLAPSLRWHAVCSTSVPFRQLHPCPCVPLDRRSHQSFLLKPQRFYAPPYPKHKPHWGSCLPTSTPNHNALPAPWLYLIRMLILIASDSFAVGNLMPCSTISMSKLTTLCWITHPSCFKAAIFH
jgi:hypothetical protein